MRGFFLTLEGPEGSGKSTQARSIVRYLQSGGFRVLHTREPGGTILGESIRKLLLDPAYSNVDSVTEFLLYQAVRSQHVREKILPHLRAGGVVVCERFSDASMAYQGYGRGLPLTDLERIDRFSTGGLVPDLTLLFDLPAEKGLRKAIMSKREFSSRGDRIERAGLAFHRRVRRGYVELASRHRRIRIIEVDARSTPDSTFMKVRAILDSRISGGKIRARHAKR